MDLKDVVFLGPNRNPPIIIMGNPPDLPVDSQSLTDPEI
jgi:hypothetical protein